MPRWVLTSGERGTRIGEYETDVELMDYQVAAIWEKWQGVSIVGSVVVRRMPTQPGTAENVTGEVL